MKKKLSLQSFLQANNNQRMYLIKDDLKILILKEIKIDYDYFTNLILSISKKDNIYFDYIKEDFNKYINKIINNRIDDNLNHFTNIKLSDNMINYLSLQFKLYLKKLINNFTTIMYSYISDILNDKIE